MTRLRKMMLEELQRRNFCPTTIKGYLRSVEAFARHFGRPPDQLGLDEIRSYQAYLLQERKIGVRTAAVYTVGLRFFFCKTLKRTYPLEELPYPKRPRSLPIILTHDEAVRLIESASNLFHRAMLMTLYSTGMRRIELCHLKVENIDSERMLIHIRHGKGARDRSVPLSPRLLETWREYYRWMRPQTYLFAGAHGNWRVDKPITPKVVWIACREAAQRGASANPSARICCGIASPRTCLRKALICLPYKRCSAMPSSRRRRSICTCPNVISKRRGLRSTKRSFPAWTKSNDPRACIRRSETAAPRGGRYHSRGR